MGVAGGSHVYFAVEATGIHPGHDEFDAPQLRFSVVDDDGVVVAAGEKAYEAFSGTGYGSRLTGITSVSTSLDWDEYEEYILEHGDTPDREYAVTVYLEAVDSCGTVVEDQRRVLFSLY